MILADFQRGRLPYFVPPPKPDGFEVSSQTKKIDKIEFVPATNNEKAEGDEEIADNAQLEKRVKGVKQNLTGINVEPDFIEEDIEGDPMDDNEDLLIDGVEEEELSSADEDDASEDDKKETENQGDKEVDETWGGQGGDTAMLVDLTTTVEENQNSFEILQENGDGRKIKTDKKQSKADKKKRSADQLKKKAGDLSFTVMASEMTSSDENISEGHISKIKAKIEAEDEEQILTSLTPEEKAFLGIKEDEDEDHSEEDESEDEAEEEISDYGDDGAQNNKEQAVDAKEDHEDDEDDDEEEDGEDISEER